MGIDYTTSVVFGTFAKEGTAAHSALAALIEGADDATADVEGTEEVIVRRHGSSWSGEWRYALRLMEAPSLTTRGGGITGPVALPPITEAEVRAAIKALGLSADDFEPIGMYIVTDVW